jgi:hypothetical protein
VGDSRRHTRAAGATPRITTEGVREAEGRLARSKALGLLVKEVRETANSTSCHNLMGKVSIVKCAAYGKCLTVDAMADGTLKMMDITAFRSNSMNVVAMMLAVNAIAK